MLVAALLRTGAVLRAEFGRKLRRYKLRPLDVEVMRVVAAEPWISGALLTTRLRLERQSLTRTLADLRELGALKVEYSWFGRRMAAWALTPFGHQGLELADGLLRELEEKFLGSFPVERAAELARLLPYGIAAVYHRERLGLAELMRMR
jgi:DNA-binding MarR family transcriptional regulator